MRCRTVPPRSPALLSAATLAWCAVLGACVPAPDPPPPAEDLSGLAAQYDHPSASIPNELVSPLIDEGRRYAELGEMLERLRFVRDAIIDSNVGLAERTQFADVVLQGSIVATIPCPGDVENVTTPGGDDPPDGGGADVDAGGDGWLRLQLGVENSHLRRGFEGNAEGCRLTVSVDSPHAVVVVSAKVVGDLGADLDVGSATIPNFLLKLTDIRATVVFTSAGSIDVTRDEYHFRLTDNDAVEVLLDPVSMGLPDLGSVVFTVRADGSMALRESRGEWRCGTGGRACVLH